MHDITLPHLLHKGAQSHPDAVFLEEVDGARLSYQEAEQMSLHWAHAFSLLGVVPGDTVLSMAPASPALVCAWLGLGWLRAIDVGVNLEYRGTLLRDLIVDSRAKIMLARHRNLAVLLEALTDCEQAALDTIVVLDGDGQQVTTIPTRLRILHAKEILSAAASTLLPFPRHCDIACLIYTSGTTGAAKGVLIPWAQLHANCIGSINLYRAGDTYYSPFPLNHASGRLPIYFMALILGRVILRERFSASEFWNDIRRYRCTTTSMPGTIAAALLARPLHPNDADNPLRFVTMVPLIRELKEFKARFKLEVRTMFNQTELSSPLMSVGTDLVDDRSCGRVRSGFEVRLVDEYDEEVPAGTNGELIVRAERPWTLMAGYFNRPQATAEAWRNGWFHTGDLFRCDDKGNYYYIDRLKDCIRRRGENISSVELERIANEYPGVIETAAVGIPAELGEEEIKLVVLPRPGESVDPSGLARFLAIRLPRFMVPRYIDIVAELPRTPAMQRVQKVRLREMGITPTSWDRMAGAPSDRN